MRAGKSVLKLSLYQNHAPLSSMKRRVTVTFNELSAVFQSDNLDPDAQLMFFTGDDSTDEFIIDDVVDTGSTTSLYLRER
jgi:adenine/guanine phosphoribosyltransferase-like PRPP-binding protein